MKPEDSQTKGEQKKTKLERWQELEGKAKGYLERVARFAKPIRSALGVPFTLAFLGALLVLVAIVNAFGVSGGLAWGIEAAVAISSAVMKRRRPGGLFPCRPVITNPPARREPHRKKARGGRRAPVGRDRSQPRRAGRRHGVEDIRLFESRADGIRPSHVDHRPFVDQQNLHEG